MTMPIDPTTPLMTPEGLVPRPPHLVIMKPRKPANIREAVDRAACL